MEKEQNNLGHGLILDVVKPEHYVLGGFGDLPKDVLQADRDWSFFLPVHEPQSHEGFESYNCTRYGTYHQVAILMKRLFGVNTFPDTDGDYNWSERFGGIIGNTTPNGNSPHSAYDDIRAFGLLDEMFLPFSPDIDSWGEYYSPKPMTQQHLDKAKGWLSHFDIKYEWVYGILDGTVEERAEKIWEALQYSPLGVSVYAWKLNPATGLYIRPAGAASNHWVTLIGGEYKKYFKIFDTYGPFIKIVPWDFDFELAKRIHIVKKTVESTVVAPVSFLELILKFLRWIKLIK